MASCLRLRVVARDFPFPASIGARSPMEHKIAESDEPQHRAERPQEGECHL